MEKIVEVNSKELQEMLELVARTNSWDSVNWNKFKTVPGDRKGDVKLKNRQGIVRYLFDAQRTGFNSECDTHVFCTDGFVPCHRIVLQQFSPLLNSLIVDNIKEIGIPTQNNVITITLADFTLTHILEVLMIFYTGFSIFPSDDSARVFSLLEFLQVDVTKTKYRMPTADEIRKKKSLKRFETMSDNESVDDNNDRPKKGPPSCRTKDWVQKLSVPECKKDEEEEEEEEEEEKEFVKVPPGSLLNRKPYARIKQRGNKTSGVKSPPIQDSPKKVADEPQPSTSRAAMSTNNINNDFSEYSPDEGSSSESDSASEKVHSDSDSDEDFIKVTKPNLRNRISRSSKNNENINTTLAERVKSVSRYPQRERKESARKESSRRLSLESHESNKPRIRNEKRDRKKIIERESTEDIGNTVTTTPKAPKQFKNRSGNNFKCFFCKNLYSSDLELLHHSASVCGTHLNGKFEYVRRKCLICMRKFKAFSHYGLLRHVQNCFMESPRKKEKLDDDDDDESSSAASEDEDDEDQYDVKCEEDSDQEEREIMLEDHKIYGDEKFPIAEPSVVVEKLSDDRIVKIIASVNLGQNVVIPRPRGYNYVKVTPKTEIPDYFPEESVEETLARIKVMEQEQIDSQREHDERKRLKALVVPPLILNRSRLLAKEEVAMNAQEFFEKLTVCSCGTKFPTIHATKKHIASHSHKRCWICCEFISTTSPIENHYRTTHELLPGGEVICPICKVPTKYLGLHRHMTVTHLQNLSHAMDTSAPMENKDCSPSNSGVASVSQRRITGSSSEEEDLTNYGAEDILTSINNLKEAIQREDPESHNRKKHEKKLKKLEKKLSKVNSPAVGNYSIQNKSQGISHQFHNANRKRPCPTSVVEDTAKKSKVQSPNKDQLENEQQEIMAQAQSVASKINNLFKKKVPIAGNGQLPVPKPQKSKHSQASSSQPNIFVAAMLNTQSLSSKKAKPQVVTNNNPPTEVINGHPIIPAVVVQPKPPVANKPSPPANDKPNPPVFTNIELPSVNNIQPQPIIASKPPMATIYQPISMDNVQPPPVVSVQPSLAVSIQPQPVVSVQPMESDGDRAPPVVNAQPTPVQRPPNLTNNTGIMNAHAGPSVQAHKANQPPLNLLLTNNVHNINIPALVLRDVQPSPETNNISAPTALNQHINGNANLQAEQPHSLRIPFPKPKSNILPLSFMSPIQAVTVNHNPTATSQNSSSTMQVPDRSATITTPTISQIIDESYNQRALVPVQRPNDHNSNDHNNSSTSNQIVLASALRNPTPGPNSQLSYVQPGTAVLSNALQRGLLSQGGQFMRNSQPIPELENDRHYCGQTMMNGQTFNVYRRGENTRPHPNAIVSVTGVTGNVSNISNMISQQNVSHQQQPMRAILPPPISTTGCRFQAPNMITGGPPQANGSSSTEIFRGTRQVPNIQNSQRLTSPPDIKPSPIFRINLTGATVTSNAPPPSNVRICPACNRHFNSADMFDSHFCNL